MIDIDIHRVRNGVARLLNAPRDLERWDARICAPAYSDASEEHRRLFDAYKTDLRNSVVRAVEVWEGETQGWASAGRTRDEAVQEMWMTYPAGPAAQPFFVALIRRYWLDCDAINRVVPKSQAVAPEAFLLGWLVVEGPAEVESVKILSCMPYWPLGLDREGNWI